MTPQFAMDLIYLVIVTSAKISAPFLLSAVVTGVIINIFQTVTQIRDQSLTFVPKLAVAAGVTLFSLSWLMEQVLGFFTQIFRIMSQVHA